MLNIKELLGAIDEPEHDGYIMCKVCDRVAYVFAPMPKEGEVAYSKKCL